MDVGGGQRWPSARRPRVPPTQRFTPAVTGDARIAGPDHAASRACFASKPIALATTATGARSRTALRIASARHQCDPTSGPPPRARRLKRLLAAEATAAGATSRRCRRCAQHTWAARGRPPPTRAPAARSSRRGNRSAYLPHSTGNTETTRTSTAPRRQSPGLTRQLPGGPGNSPGRAEMVALAAVTPPGVARQSKTPRPKRQVPHLRGNDE